MPRLRLPAFLTRPRQLTRSSLLYMALVLLVLVFVPLIVTTSRWMHAIRIDLTADQLYTLSPGTLHIVDDLRRPLKLTLYFSEHATRDLPQLRSYEQRVREMLQEMVARSHGLIRLQIIDPVPYSDDEANAEGSGLTAASGGSNGERVFFGLAGNRLSSDNENEPANQMPDKALGIPFFDPAREAFLEYDIAKLLYELDQTCKPPIGVISSLPVEGKPILGQQPWAAVQQLGQLFDLRMLDPASLKQVDPGLKMLWLIQPTHLSSDALYAIDQYLLHGGHLAVFVDPDAELQGSPYDVGGVLPEHSSDLPRLFATWGVTYDPRKVVLDRSRALQIELAGSSLNHPAMLGLGAQELNRNDVITASLQRVNLSTAGYFGLAADSSTRLIPLFQSTGDAEAVSTQRTMQASADPVSLLQDYQPDSVHYVLAARLQGPFHSAFPERAGEPG